MNLDFKLDDPKSYKVIVLRVPEDLEGRLLSFSFFHHLREKFSEAQIHFITPKWRIEVLNLLPFQAFYHEVEQTEMKDIFDVHRFAATAKIGAVDLYLNLTESFLDTFLGFSLKAKVRLGFEENWKKYLLTHKMPRLRGQHVAEEQLELLKLLPVGEVDLKLKCLSRDLDCVVPNKDERPYLAIDLSPLYESEIDDAWVEFVNLMSKQRIIFFASSEPEKANLYYESFRKKLSPNNVYDFFIYSDWIVLGKLLAHAQGVITYQGAIAALSTYVGSRTIILYERENAQERAPFYFLSDFLILDLKDPTLRANVMKDSGSLIPRSKFNMDEVFQRAYSFFRLSF